MIQLLQLNPLSTITQLDGVLLVAVLCGLMFIEETGIPVPFAPGDLVLILGGLAISSGSVDPTFLVVALIVSISAGGMIGREVFALVGRAALNRAADALRFRKALDRASRMMERGGARAVFLGRLIPGLRIHTTQVAGVTGVPRLTFAAGLIPSVVIYVAVFVGVGALVGQPAVGLFHQAERRLFVLAATFLVVLGLVLSIRALARRGALDTLEPFVLGVRRDLADELERHIPGQGGPEARWRQYPLVRRIWAGLADLALTFALTLVVLTALAGLGNTEAVFDPPGLALLLSIAFVYRAVLEGFSGQTLGKKVMGVSVYGPEGGRPGWVRAIVRNLPLVVPVLWIADLVMLAVGRRRQRLGDLLAATTVRKVSN